MNENSPTNGDPRRWLIRIPKDELKGFLEKQISEGENIKSSFDPRPLPPKTIIGTPPPKKRGTSGTSIWVPSPPPQKQTVNDSGVPKVPEIGTKPEPKYWQLMRLSSVSAWQAEFSSWDNLNFTILQRGYYSQEAYRDYLPDTVVSRVQHYADTKKRGEGDIIFEWILGFIRAYNEKITQLKRYLHELRFHEFKADIAMLQGEKDQKLLETSDIERTPKSNGTKRKSPQDKPDAIEIALSGYIEDYKKILNPRIYEYVRDAERERLLKFLTGPAAQADPPIAYVPEGTDPKSIGPRPNINRLVDEFIAQKSPFKINENEPLFPVDYYNMRERIERRNAEVISYIEKNIPNAPPEYLQAVRKSMIDLPRPALEPFSQRVAPSHLTLKSPSREKVCDSATRGSLGSSVSSIINYIELLKVWHIENRNRKPIEQAPIDSIEPEAIISLKGEVQKLPSIVGKKIEDSTQEIIDRLGIVESDKDADEETDKTLRTEKRPTGVMDRIYKKDTDGFFYIRKCVENPGEEFSINELYKERLAYKTQHKVSRPSDFVTPIDQNEDEESFTSAKNPRYAAKIMDMTYEKLKEELKELAAAAEKARFESNNVALDQINEKRSIIEKLSGSRRRFTKVSNENKLIRKRVYKAMDDAIKCIEEDDEKLAQYLKTNVKRRRGYVKYTGKKKII